MANGLDGQADTRADDARADDALAGAFLAGAFPVGASPVGASRVGVDLEVAGPEADVQEDAGREGDSLADDYPVGAGPVGDSLADDYPEGDFLVDAGRVVESPVVDPPEAAGLVVADLGDDPQEDVGQADLKVSRHQAFLAGRHLLAWMAIVLRLDAGYRPGVGQYWVVARHQVEPAVAQRSPDSAGNWLRHHPQRLPRRNGPPCQCLALGLENHLIGPDSDAFPPMGENFPAGCSGGYQGDLDATRAVCSVVSMVVSTDALMVAKAVVQAEMVSRMAAVQVGMAAVPVEMAGMLAGMAVMLAGMAVGMAVMLAAQVVGLVVRDSSKVIELGSLTNDPSTNDPSIDRPRLVHPSPDQALAQPAKNWSIVNTTCKN